MAAYLIVDVDDLIEHFRRRNIAVDLQTLAVGLRGGAALAAGVSGDKLKAVAVANWKKHRQAKARASVDPQYVFKAAGYNIFDIPHRESLADALIMNYFSYDPEPVDELILATTNPDLIPLVRRVKRTRNARVRMWGSDDVLEGTEFADQIIFQPLETLLGIQQTKNVAIYIDFENIAISLNEQGYIVNLDTLIESFARQGKAHGQVVKTEAYAPWTQRGSLPPLVDLAGREIAEEATTRLMIANIDPVITLPGKNSADMKMSNDILRDSGHSDAADVYIVASGDRDFKDMINALRARNKTVIIWSVHGSTSRQLENNPNLTIEYIEDFTNLQTHQSLSLASMAFNEDGSMGGFTPSQWSSVIIQFDRVALQMDSESLTRQQLIDQLIEVGAVVSQARGEDLVSQAISLGILRPAGGKDHIVLDYNHPVVEKTTLIRDRIVVRVVNTLNVRGWEYVNYGFLLKGLAMDRELERPGLNYSDQWRSDWIDCLVREKVLLRELVPHRHNPEDLVPVIKLNPEYEMPDDKPVTTPQEDAMDSSWSGVALTEVEQMEPETADMVRRVVVSVEQFTSFRGFTWCPLGSLHKRLRAFDNGVTFQRGVEYLIENNAAEVKEYPNPQSEFFTKGISLNNDSEICQNILNERDTFIRLLLYLYDRNMVISDQSVRMVDPGTRWNLELWFSIMETENVLNPVPGRQGQYSLFRTHHTVTLVADAQRAGRREP
ncbi:MAG TPA: NYN domain-containing protein [Phototrophicaceae bacterium]|nr:NYN domain-containing protein [Phototrophicaceae bacterium]